MYNKFREKYLQINDKNVPYNIPSKKGTKLKQKPRIFKATSNKIKKYTL